MTQFSRIEPGSYEGDMLALYESFFKGAIFLNQKKGIADLRQVTPIYPDYDHYNFLVNHLKSLGFTIIEKGDG